MTPALELRQVGRRFGATQVLAGVSLAVMRGERHAIIGPNGAGKSTLFNLVCGTLRPNTGRILLDGADITSLAAFEISRRGLARSHQITSLFAHLPVFDNLRCAVLGARRQCYAFWRPLQSMREVRERAEAVMAAVGLAQSRDTPAGELPYAAQRALEIGIAIAGDAAEAGGAGVVLLDEPTAGMSQDEATAAVDLIRRATAGKTLLMVEHDMAVVFGIADRVSVLAGGALIATGTPAEIRANRAVRDAYLGDAFEHA